MSVVVAKRVKNGFIMAGDSQVTKGDEKDTVIKVFKSYKENEIYLGVVGSLRDSQILMTINGLLDPNAIRREELDLLSIISYTVPLIKKTMKENDRLYNEDGKLEWDSEVMILYKDKGYIIESDFSVIEIDEFDAIGSPRKFAKGSYELYNRYKDKIKVSDRQIVKDIVRITIEKTTYVGYPIRIADTSKNEDFEIIKGNLVEEV